MREVYKLNEIVIKPTFACQANCPTCEYEQKLHNTIRDKKLSLEDWKKILCDAHVLGARYLTISGGEPTLYKQLVDLVSFGKEKGFFVGMNSNGGIITQEFANVLLDAGLGEICISLYSHIPEVHDRMKAKKGIWHQSCNAIKIFSDLKKKYPWFTLSTQTFISKENYSHFDELLKLHYSLGSDSITISYLQGDHFKKENLLNVDQINYFRDKVLPRAIEFCGELDPVIREYAVCKLRNFYNPQLTSSFNYSQGVYRPRNGFTKPCKKPENFALIVANGDVHPCNGVGAEHFHEPAIGNVFKERFIDIWDSGKWNNFRRNYFNDCKIDYCVFCPVPLHFGMGLRMNTHRYIWERARCLQLNSGQKMFGLSYVRKYMINDLFSVLAFIKQHIWGIGRNEDVKLTAKGKWKQLLFLCNLLFLPLGHFPANVREGRKNPL